jgi:hypothetical protein
MFRRNFIHVVCCFALLQISGCGNKDSQKTENSASENQPTEKLAITPMESSQSGVVGYKSFKFGMSPIEVAKLPECVESYKAANNIGGEDKLRNLETELQNLKADTTNKIDTLKKRVEAYGLDEDKSELESIQNQNPVEAKEKEIFAFKDQIKNTSEFSADTAKQWVDSSGICVIEIFNEKANLHPEFEAGKLVAVEIELGGFNNEKFQTIAKSLADKYTVSQTYTNEQAESFNQHQLNKIHVTYDSGQVSLVAADIATLDAITAAFGPKRGAEYNLNDYISNERVMILQYFDLAHAQLAEKAAIKGKVTEEDL